MDFNTLQNIQVEDVDMKDYPKFCDAYIASAEHADGTELTDAELDIVNEDMSFVYEAVQQHLY
jgi:hypothetical protein